ncbi:restriction endonuclease subunit S [Candidatus Magnetaquicoccus inordinatus]|uniref:restriction endonuclease subunit S n=1 Tax=Candidatus Magnetaquicoccus inordinatus TaxID=2496818 RepID=UPI00102AA293|nr:restriction endonuclease subunit S [Candidatus Magnetaquicoccus inordinatus]
MKSEWQTKSLADVCQFSNGLWKGENPPFVHIGVIRNTNFTKEGVLDDSDIAYLDVEEKKFEKRRLQFGDIILEKSGGGPKQPVGRVVLFDKTEGDFSFSNFTTAIRVSDPNDLYFRFLHKFLHWTYLSGVTEGMQSHSTGIRNLNGDAYKSIKISFPLVSEQQRIVAILDKAFDGIATAKANTEKNLQNAHAIFESHLHGFNAPRVPLGMLVKITTGKLDANAAIEGGKYPFFTCSRDVYAIDSYAFDCEAILLAGNNAIGDFNVKHYNGKFNAYQRTYIITVNEQKRALCRFIYFQLLKSLKQFKDQSVGVGTKFLKIGMIQRLEIALPTSISEQEHIVSIMDAVRTETQRLETLYQQKLILLDELKKSLLHQAFSGQL